MIVCKTLSNSMDRVQVGPNVGISYHFDAIPSHVNGGGRKGEAVPNPLALAHFMLVRYQSGGKGTPDDPTYSTFTMIEGRVTDSQTKKEKLHYTQFAELQRKMSQKRSYAYHCIRKIWCYYHESFVSLQEECALVISPADDARAGPYF